VDPRLPWRSRLELRFREGVSWREDGGPGLWLVAPPLAPLSLAGQSPGVLAVLRRLWTEGGMAEPLAEEVARREGAWAMAAFLLLLRQLEELRLLAFTLRGGSEVLASLHPASAWFELRPVELDPRRPYVLSRFAYQHRVGQSMVVESPRSHAVLRLEDARAAALCLALARPLTLEELVQAAPGMAAETVEAFVCLLLAAELVVPVDAEGQSEEERSPQLAPWMFHDLLFHARSRVGRHAGPCAKTYPFRDRLPPLPAIRPPPESPGEAIRLHRPDLDAVLASDPPLTEVLERRQSVRVHGAEPITVEQLGGLLYRAARVRKRIPATPELGYEISNRPYPSGGACYDLEIYLAVDRCRGLASGLYHYDPEGHCLVRRSERTPSVEALLADATFATLSQQPPQVLVCLASRFQRVSWSYEGIAYAITLKNAGVLYQTFYLVATAMGLACSGVGRGDSDIFAKAAGTDYFAETTVGELVLGSL
jgi:oxazoline/thiazoline dehydrogenase